MLFITLQIVATFADINSWIILRLLPYVANEPSIFVFIMFGVIPTLLATVSSLISAISYVLGIYDRYIIVSAEEDGVIYVGN